MFFQEDDVRTLLVYDGAFVVVSESERPDKINLKPGFVEKPLRYESDGKCPECGAKRFGNECLCGLRVAKCTACNYNSYVVYLASCIRPECGNTYLP